MTTAEFTDVEIRILRRELEGYPVELSTPGRQFPRGRIDLAPDLPVEGERVFEALLSAPPLRSAWDELRGLGPRRRFRLRIDADAPELHALAWETLREVHPERGPILLGADAATPFSRYLAGPWEPPAPLREPKIRLLLAIANPDDLSERYNLAAIDPAREEAGLREALSDLDQEQLTLTVLAPPLTLARLEAELKKGHHALHLVAHGMWSARTGTAALYLADPANLVSLVSEADFAAMLARQEPSLRLIFFAACQSATRSPADAFRGLAPRAVAAGIPSVLAMQDLVPVVTAREFARTFYRQLFTHGLVDLASNEARSALLSAKLAGGAIPVLFSRLTENRLFEPTFTRRIDCPYPGMLPYAADDAGRFFGRDREIEDTLQHLRRRRFLLVVGPSGSGKSSLITAGVLPRLGESSYFPPGFWTLRRMRPGRLPTRALADLLEGCGAGDAETRSAVGRLVEAEGAERLLLYVDQLEELFTLASPEEQARFVALLGALRDDERCAVVCSMRADFYPALMNSALWPIDPGQRLEVAPLRGQALRDAIVRPAAEVGVELEPALVERLLTDAAGEPGALPLVQETLVLLWDRREGRRLRLAAYEALGRDGRSGLAVAIATRAEDMYLAMTPAEQVEARRILLCLIQFGEGRSDTRRQQPLDALGAHAAAREAFDSALRALMAHRLLVAGGEEASGRNVDISHEALIAGWPRLGQWIAGAREAELGRRRLEEKAIEWRRLRSSGPLAGLLDAVELLEADRFLENAAASGLGASAELRSLVDASRRAIENAARQEEEARRRELDQVQALADAERRRAEEEARAARRLRWFAAVLAAALVGAMISGAVAVLKAREAERQRGVARRQGRISTGRLLGSEAAATGRLMASIAERSLGGRLDTALLLAVRAHQIFDEFNSRATLATAIERSRAVLAFLGGFTGRVRSVAYSPDGRWLAAPTGPGRVRLWDLRTHAPAGELFDPDSATVSAVAFSADGNRIATLAAARTADRGEVLELEGRRLRLWDAATRRPLSDLELGGRALYSLAFSPDGGTLAAGLEEGTVMRWDARTLSPLPELRAAPAGGGGATAQIRTLQFSAAGAGAPLLVAGSTDGSVLVWDARSGERLFPELPRRHTMDVSAVAVAPGGGRFASGSVDGGALLWDVLGATATARPLRLPTRKAVSALAFSPDGTRVASAGLDGIVVLSDPATGEVVGRPLVGQGREIDCLAIAPDGRTLATGSDDHVVLWDLTEHGATRPSLPGTSLAFSPGGEVLAVGQAIGQAGAVVLIDPATLRPLARLPTRRPVDRLAWSPDGALLVSDGGERGAILWDARRPAELAELAEDEPISALAYASRGDLVAIGGGRGTVRLWDVARRAATGPPLETGLGRVKALAFAPDGSVLASGSITGKVILWDVKARARRCAEPISVRSHDAITGLAFRPDPHGATLAVAAKQLPVQLWDTGKCPAEAGESLIFAGDAARRSTQAPPSVYALALGTAGLAAWGGEDTMVTLWDLGAHLPLGPPLEGHLGVVRALAVSDRGLVASSDGGSLRTWSARVEDWPGAACARANRNLTMEEWTRFEGDLQYCRVCAGLPAGAGTPPSAPACERDR